jgi:hypothetical protein
MMNSSREWNFPAVMTAKKLLMKNYATIRIRSQSTIYVKERLASAGCMFTAAS